MIFLPPATVCSIGFIIGGFLVGFGTRVSNFNTICSVIKIPVNFLYPCPLFALDSMQLGNGCTTGHGICGMARLSVRSFVGVASFMATGMLSATGCSPTCPFHKYLRDSYDSIGKYLPTDATTAIGTVLASLAAGAAMPGFFRQIPETATAEEKDLLENNKRKIIPSIVSAALFSLGLVISKMTVSSKIYGFLDMKGFKTGTWDPTLVCVMGGGFLVSFLSYQWVKGHNVFKVRVDFIFSFF